MIDFNQYKIPALYYIIILTGITFVIYLMYFVLGYYGYLRGLMDCLSFKNLVLGKWGRCINAFPRNTCQDLDHGFVYGWCNDADNNGPLPGTREGPYEGYCAEWSWKKDQCPPAVCKGDYPYGIGKQLPYQKWGWCADASVNRPMKGTSCGPSDGQCVNWVWNEEQCSDMCPAKFSDEEQMKEEQEEQCGPQKLTSLVCGEVNGENISCPPLKMKNKCNNVCGKVKGPNGQIVLQCPPPTCDCADDDKCICQKRSLSLW